MVQRRPGYVQRSLGRQRDQIKRRHRSARSAEQHHVPSRTQNVQPFLKRRLPHGVINDVDTLAARELFGLLFEIGLRVQNDVVRPGIFRQLRLLIRRDGSDHSRSNLVRHLGQ